MVELSLVSGIEHYFGKSMIFGHFGGIFQNFTFTSWQSGQICHKLSSYSLFHGVRNGVFEQYNCKQTNFGPRSEHKQEQVW